VDSPPLSLLVADDDPDTVESTVTLLGLHGFRASGALGGRAALRAARADPPDVVLIDLEMPGVGGCDVARCLRGDGGFGPVLVAVTGRYSEEDRLAAEAAEFDHYLLKPVPPAALVALLKAIEADPAREVRRAVVWARRRGESLAQRTEESRRLAARSRLAAAGARQLLDHLAVRFRRAWPGSSAPDPGGGTG
jgi:CheY-like chemotaxis protein